MFVHDFYLFSVGDFASVILSAINRNGSNSLDGQIIGDSGIFLGGLFFFLLDMSKDLRDLVQPLVEGVTGFDPYISALLFISCQYFCF